MTQGLAGRFFRVPQPYSVRPAFFVVWLLINVTGIAAAIPPAIDRQSESRTVVLFEPTSFSAIATGTPPFSYQWYKDGALLSWGTNDQILIPKAQLADAGHYWVVVSNHEGSVTSDEALLTVNPPLRGDLDYTFVSGGSINGPVLSVAATPEGRIIIAGGFSTVFRAARGGIARLQASGATDETFASAAPTDGVFSSVALQNDGKILVAGYFTTTVNDVNRTCIARLNMDGTLDTDFGNQLPGANSSVNSVAVQPDGRPLIGGDFTMVNDLPCNRIARLNADGTLDTSFLSGLPGADNSVTCIAVQNDGRILIGGYFTNVNDFAYNRIARLHTDGGLDGGFMDNLSGANGCVQAIAVQDDGKVLIVGDFSAVNDCACNRIARLNPDGSLDTAFQSSLSGVDEGIHALALQTDGKILIGGYFTTISGRARNYIARLHADGTLDTAFQDSLSGANYYVRSIVVQGDGRIVIAGLFTAVNGTSRSFVARLNPNGSLDPAFEHQSLGADNIVDSIAVQPDGKVLIGGDFATVSGRRRNSIARLHPDATVDDSFQNGLSGANGTIQSIAVQRDTKVLIAGNFTLVNGESRNHVARLNVDGTLDTTFQKGLSGANDTVFPVVLQRDGKILIGGRFTYVNDVLRNCIARLNIDGTLDDTFQNDLPGANDTIFCVLEQSNGKILIGGSFSAVNDIDRSHLARLHSDGSLDTSFLDGLSGANNDIYSLAEQSDGKVVIGGAFTMVNGTSRHFVARLHPDGSVDHTFQLGLDGPDNLVSAVAVQKDGRVIIAGDFGRVNDTLRGGVARLHSSGALDTTFQEGLSGANNIIESMVLQPDGNVLIAGSFSLFNGMPAAGVARLWRNQPAIEEVAPGGVGVATVTVRLVPGTVNRVQYKNNLQDPRWINLPGDVSASEPTGLVQKLDNHYASGQRFYRVMLLP